MIPTYQHPELIARREKAKKLLSNIKEKTPLLEERLKEVNDHWGEEDLVYRFYHESWKVYRIQNLTQNLCSALEEISPHETDKLRDPYFNEIMADGAKSIGFTPDHNRAWSKTTRPFLEAFFHAKYFVKMAVKYGKEYEEPPQFMDSGWAALLELYAIR